MSDNTMFSNFFVITDPRQPAQPSVRETSHFGWFTVILVLGVVLRVIAFTGVVGADDVSLSSLAMRLLDSGFFLPDGHYAARIGLYYPLAAIYALFGVGEIQTALLPFAAGVLSLLLAYGIGRRMLGERAALISMLVLAVFPLDVQLATMLMPDLPLGTALAGTVYLLVRGADSERKMPWGALAGLCWGLAYLIKIEAAFLAVPVLLYGLLEPRSRLAVFWACVFVALVILAESIVYYLAGGGILHRLDAVQNQGGGRFVEEYSASQLWVFPKAWFVTFYSFGLHYYFLFAAVTWALFSRRAALYVLVSWVAAYLLWLQFGGNPFSDTYHVKSHLSRYCAMLSVPMALLIGALFAYLAEKTTALVFWGGLAAITGAALFFLNFNTLSMERELATKIALDYVVEHDLFPLYTDGTSRAVAGVYLGNHPRQRDIHSLQKHDFRTQITVLAPLGEIDGYILLNRGFMEHAWNRYRKDMVNIDHNSNDFSVLFTVNNPGNAAAYQQARLLSAVAQLIPVQFLRDKIGGTANDILRDEDAIIFRRNTTSTANAEDNSSG